MLKGFIPAIPLKGQEEYHKALQDKDIIFATGDAGTGKSFLALNRGLQLLSNSQSQINKIIIVRPYVFTKVENMGALPGNLEEKILPFAQSVYDNLHQLLHKKQDVEWAIGQMEFLTLSTIRGRSLHNAFIIVEEAQNTPLEGDAMLTILTRIGKHSKIVVAGDLSQCDIRLQDSAFIEAINALAGMNQFVYIDMTNVKNTPRNPMIRQIIDHFNNYRQQEY